MKISIRKLAKLSIHAIVLTIVLIGALLFWLVVTMEGNMRPLGSPPIGYEDRQKYVGSIPGLPGFDNVPVDLWFGKRPGQYDTTHFRIASDYITLLPHYHGESAHFMLVWPSLRSIDEEDMIQEKGVAFIC